MIDSALNKRYAEVKFRAFETVDGVDQRVGRTRAAEHPIGQDAETLAHQQQAERARLGKRKLKTLRSWASGASAIRGSRMQQPGCGEDLSLVGVGTSLQTILVGHRWQAVSHNQQVGF